MEFLQAARYVGEVRRVGEMARSAMQPTIRHEKIPPACVRLLVLWKKSGGFRSAASTLRNLRRYVGECVNRQNGPMCDGQGETDAA